MKTITTFLIIAIAVSSCTVTIPMQTNLSDQTMLLAENRNIKADYVIHSDIENGFLKYTTIQKNGVEYHRDELLKFDMPKAFTELWSSYFDSKFNSYSNDKMDIEIILKDFEFRDQQTTSIMESSFTGNSKNSLEAKAIVYVKIIYLNNIYENEFIIVTSDYNETQSMKIGESYYTSSHTNPTQQKSQLINDCMNKGIIQFENFLRSVMMTSK
jgi:hypothetical protein